MKVEVAGLGSLSLTVLMVSVDVKQHLKRICREEKKKKKKKLWFYFIFYSPPPPPPTPLVSVVKYTVHLLTVLQFISSKRKRRYQNTNCALISSTSAVAQTLCMFIRRPETTLCRSVLLVTDSSPLNAKGRRFISIVSPTLARSCRVSGV